MSRPLFRYLLLPFALALALAAGRTIAQPADIEGWRGARWGMTEAALERVFGDRLARLPGRWIYGGAYATRLIEEVSIGDQRFRAIFQMNEETGRLQQVLLETVRRPGQEAAFHSTLAALRRAYGAPDGSCGVPRAGGGPLSLELWWRFPTTTAHLTFFDFYTRGMFSSDPNVDPDPLADWFERRRNNPRFLPRRTLVRFHPTGRADLMANPCRDETPRR
jgi:hypothetical protein